MVGGNIGTTFCDDWKLFITLLGILRVKTSKIHQGVLFLYEKSISANEKYFFHMKLSYNLENASFFNYYQGTLFLWRKTKLKLMQHTKCKAFYLLA